MIEFIIALFAITFVVGFLAFIIDVTMNTQIEPEEPLLPTYTGPKLVIRNEQLRLNKELNVPDFAKSKEVYDQKEEKKQRRRSMATRRGKSSIEKTKSKPSKRTEKKKQGKRPKRD